MLWIALHFPSLTIQVLLRGLPDLEKRQHAWALFERHAVIACNDTARSRGIAPGMSRAAAVARDPGVRLRLRDTSREQAALREIGLWMLQFTPQVSLVPPSDVLAEIGGSVRHFGGISCLSERVGAGLQALGFDAQWAVAPTAHAARWLAAAGGGRVVMRIDQLDEALGTVPVAVIGLDGEARALLESVGVRTLGMLLRLPREGVAHRCGQGLLDALDCALGRATEIHPFISPPDHFSATLELACGVDQSEGLLFAVRRLLAQLEGFLKVRQAAARALHLCLQYRDPPHDRVDVGFSNGGRTVERMLSLLRARLERFTLRAPVHALRLEACDLMPYGGMHPDFFDTRTGDRESRIAVVERLQTRLGTENVYGVVTREDHRPERGWRAVSPTEEHRAGAVVLQGRRPLWIIDPPRRLGDVEALRSKTERLELVSGPERIETGWWDGEEVRRDYFVARTSGAALIWVFRIPGGDWYLQGIFG